MGWGRGSGGEKNTRRAVVRKLDPFVVLRVFLLSHYPHGKLLPVSTPYTAKTAIRTHHSPHSGRATWMGRGTVPAVELRNVLALSRPAVNGSLNDGPRASRGREGGAGEDRTLERRGRATRAMAAIVGVTRL